MEAKQLLGLDIGNARSGLARASSLARLAEPLFSVDTANLLSTIKDFQDSSDLSAVVVGLPRNLDGQDTEQTRRVRNWVDKTKPKLNLPMYWQDEALTSQKARALSSELSTKGSFDEHALAAAIILQDFLDAPEAERALC